MTIIDYPREAAELNTEHQVPLEAVGNFDTQRNIALWAFLSHLDHSTPGGIESARDMATGLRLNDPRVSEIADSSPEGMLTDAQNAYAESVAEMACAVVEDEKPSVANITERILNEAVTREGIYETLFTGQGMRQGQLRNLMKDDIHNSDDLRAKLIDKLASEGLDKKVTIIQHMVRFQLAGEMVYLRNALRQLPDSLTDVTRKRETGRKIGHFLANAGQKFHIAW